ncbi:MAG: hypothetical protein ACK5MI_08605 [Mangrovibacterium sp.]
MGNTLTIGENSYLGNAVAKVNDVYVKEKGYAYLVPFHTINGNISIANGGAVSVGAITDVNDTTVEINDGKVTGDIIADGGTVRLDNVTVEGTLITKNHSDFLTGSVSANAGVGDSAQVRFSSFVHILNSGSDGTKIGEDYPIFLNVKHSKTIIEKSLTLSNNVKIYAGNSSLGDTLRINGPLILEGKLTMYADSIQKLRIIADGFINKGGLEPIMKNRGGIPGPADTWDSVFTDTTVSK